jgi:predicted membrane-bound mannosyltransferase/DNA-binding beta-propeller fold protein YncE
MSDNVMIESAPQRATSDRSLMAFVVQHWETIAWAVVLIVATVLRLYDLGVRAMGHDESLHTLYGYYLFNEGRYEHNPMMHGPFRFHMTALTYFLLGATDTTSRLVPALFGIFMVVLMIPMRRYLGRTGALVAAVLITFSPSLLFHSRYIRDDIFIAAWTTLWALSAFRYLETRRFRWLALMVAAMAFSFVTMENSFITGAVFGGFFVLLALWQVIDLRIFAVLAPVILTGVISYYYHYLDQDNIAIPVLVVGGAVALILLIVMLVTRRGSWQRLRHIVSADLAVLMLTLVLPFMASFLHLVLGGDSAIFKDSAYLDNSMVMRLGGLVALATGLSTAIAFYWFHWRKSDGEEPGLIQFGQWASLMALFWIVEVLFFTTFFTNTRNGLGTGIVGSLGYWLAQQKVERGSQPWYYYGFIGSIYEFLPILLTAAGAITLLRGLLFVPGWRTVAASDLPPDGGDAATPASADLARTGFVVFALVWVVGMWTGYTVAGEKMPWLLTHMALPMCVFGGWWLGRLIHSVEWARAWRTRAVWLIAVIPALLLITVIMLRGISGPGRSLNEVAAIMRTVLSLAAWLGLVYLIWCWGSAGGWRLATKLMGLGVVAILFVFSVRASLTLTFVNYDMATEYLVYAHASPDVKRALAEIDAISARTVGDRNIVVAYDDESSWPFSWYMRQYPNAKFYGANPNSDSMSAPVVIVGPKNRDKVRPYLERDYAKRTYRLIWWPDMDYFGLTWERIKNAFTDPQQRERIWQILMYRRHRDTADFSRFRDLTQWPARHEFDMYVRRDLAGQIWDLSVTPLAGGPQNPVVAVPEVDATASAIYSDIYDGMALRLPRTVAVAANGERVIADTGNHRIVVLDANGQFLHAFGSFCDLGRGAEGGCVDPDGSGPLQLGDGQFNEPWGVAAGADGTVYVADTWNGRIQAFDSSGKFLRTWGYFNTTNGELGDANALFGPRGLAVDLDGNVLVADTGNKRVIRFTPAGELVTQIGGGGVIAGRFDEPTALAVDPNDGSVFVADAWNRRIQKFDSTLAFVAEWPVPGWESKDIYHKPYVAVTANGDVYATDPQFFRVFVYDRTGTLKATFGKYGTEPNRFGMPNGVAADLASSSVLVADADNNRVMVFPNVP